MSVSADRWNHGALKPGFDQERVRVQQVRTTEMRSDDIGWTFRTQLPGFRKVSTMKRQTGEANAESLHVVFSDGLASISVFIEPGGAPESRRRQATVSVR
jgi:sigma-E factor negative regulatory protein RseB